MLAFRIVTTVSMDGSPGTKYRKSTYNGSCSWSTLPPLSKTNNHFCRRPYNHRSTVGTASQSESTPAQECCAHRTTTGGSERSLYLPPLSCPPRSRRPLYNGVNAVECSSTPTDSCLLRRRHARLPRRVSASVLDCAAGLEVSRVGSVARQRWRKA